MATVVVGLVKVEFFDMERLVEVWGLVEHTAKSVGDEAAAPELHAALAACAVDADNGDAVGHGMAALDGLPGLILFAVVLLGLAHVPADGRGEEEELRAHEAGDAGCFGVPLVPADKHAEGGKTGLKDAIAKVARGEVEFFVVARVVGDVHLAVFAQVGAVGINNRGGVVVEPFGTFLKEGADKHHAQLGGKVHEVLAGGAVGYGFGQLEILVAFLITKIEGGEQFLKTDNMGTLRGKAAHRVGVAGYVGLLVGYARHLGNTYFDFH